MKKNLAIIVEYLDIVATQNNTVLLVTILISIRYKNTRRITIVQGHNI